MRFDERRQLLKGFHWKWIMRTMVIALKAPNSLHLSLYNFWISLSRQLQDSYDCKSKREKRKQPLLKNEIKRKKASQLFNSHSLHLTLSPLSKFSKIGIGQMRKISISFSILWLSLSQSFTQHSLFIFFCFMQDPKTSSARYAHQLTPSITAYSILDYLFVVVNTNLQSRSGFSKHSHK